MPTPVVFIPALLCDEELFEDLIARLGGQVAAQVMMSPQPDLAASAADILARAPARFALAGVSYGASLALEIALQAPQRVTALWLTGCNPGAPKQLMTTGMAEMIETDLDGAIAMLSNLVVRAGDNRAEARFKAMAARVGAAAGSAAAHALGHRQDRWARLSELTMPALVTCGRNDAVVPAATQRKLAEALPHAHFYAIPGCGHLPMLEEPAEMAAIALDFFAEDHAHEHGEHGQHGEHHHHHADEHDHEHHDHPHDDHDHRHHDHGEHRAASPDHEPGPKPMPPRTRILMNMSTSTGMNTATGRRTGTATEAVPPARSACPCPPIRASLRP